MKPINDKERTIAYFQFLALSILFIVVWTVAVFFDYRVKGKDSQVLKNENNRLKEMMKSTANLDSQIDSLANVVKGFAKLSSIEYEDARLRFKDGLSTIWSSEKEDSTDLAKIKAGLIKVYMEWYYSIGSRIREDKKNEDIKLLQAQINDLTEKLATKDRDFEDYKRSHP